jgi:hypothetical protein
VPPRFRFPRFADLPMRLFIILDAERPTLFMVRLRLLLMDLLFRFPFFEDLPITRDIILFAVRLMDLYVFLARRLKGVNIYIERRQKKI